MARQLDTEEGNPARPSSGKIYSVGGPGTNGLCRNESCESLSPFLPSSCRSLFQNMQAMCMSEGCGVYLGLFRKHTHSAKCHWEKYGMQT